MKFTCAFIKNLQLAITTLATLCGATSSSAFETKQFLYHDLWHGHTVVQLGNSWSIQGKDQNINIQGLIGDRFTVTDGNGTNGLVGIGYYLEGQNKSWGQMAYGLNFFYLAPTAVTGTVMQEQLYTNLSYRYNVTNYPLYFAAKATVNTKSPQYAVTFDGGIGPNFVHTGGFAEYPLDGITIPDHIFSGKSSTQFTATVGAGIKVNHFFGKAPLECGYRFFYLGQGAHFNTLTNQVLNTLNTGTMYANAVLCSITV